MSVTSCVTNQNTQAELTTVKDMLVCDPFLEYSSCSDVLFLKEQLSTSKQIVETELKELKERSDSHMTDSNASRVCVFFRSIGVRCDFVNVVDRPSSRTKGSPISLRLWYASNCNNSLHAHAHSYCSVMLAKMKRSFTTRYRRKVE